ncbi:hypothetical protein M8J75_012101 [Diaphorina citri]|nr:hypothetical protein M8J75_012101 [Diaphorina citri]
MSMKCEGRLFDEVLNAGASLFTLQTCLEDEVHTPVSGLKMGQKCRDYSPEKMGQKNKKVFESSNSQRQIRRHPLVDSSSNQNEEMEFQVPPSTLSSEVPTHQPRA